MPLSLDLNGHGTIHDVNESLRWRISQLAFQFKLCGVFGERCAQRRPDVHDGGRIPHPGQSRAHKSVRRLQNMIALMRAARVTEIMHGTSFPEIPAKPQAASANAVRIPALSRRRQDEPIPPDRG